MIKVLNIITNGILPEGVTCSWVSILEELKRTKLNKECQIDFLVIKDRSNKKKVDQLNDLGIKTIEINSRNNILNYIYNLIKILKRENYNVIHINGSSSLMILELIAGYLAKTPIKIAHSRNTFCRYKTLNKILSYPFRKLTDLKIACGYDAGKWLFGKDHFSILHNGKNLNKFVFSDKDRIKQRQILKLENKYVIGHVGNFNNQKNHKFLIDVFSKINKVIPNSHLVLIGDGPLKKEITQQINYLGLQNDVTLLGTINDINVKLNIFDLMLFPSLFEGLPNVVLEWQANGIPSIISNKITKECIVTDFVTQLDINNNIEKWVNSTKDIYAKEYKRKENSEVGIKSLSNHGFDVSKTVNQLIKYYKLHKNER